MGTTAYQGREGTRLDIPRGDELRVGRPVSRIGLEPRRTAHRSVATPGIPPSPLPPITQYSRAGLFVMTDWKGEIPSAGKPCSSEPPCTWSAGIAEVFQTVPSARLFAADLLVQVMARDAPASNHCRHIRSVTFEDLPIRDFGPLLTPLEATAAIEDLAHGRGTERWWRAAKASDECGAFLLPLPGRDGQVLFVFQRFLDHLLLGPPERVEFDPKCPMQ
jgi:hypothetical protein